MSNQQPRTSSRPSYHAVNEHLIPAAIERVVTQYCEKWDASAALLVGPRARGLATADSDFDIAFLLPQFNGRQYQGIRVDGVDVGLERYSIETIQSWPR